MEFLEAYKCAKKYRTSFRLPGMNYILIPKKKDDKDIINIKYHDNLKTIEDIQEFIKAAIDLNSDDWKICNSNLEYSFKNLLSFEEALEQLKAGKDVSRFSTAWDDLYLSMLPATPVVDMDRIKDKYNSNVIDLLNYKKLVLTNFESMIEYTDDYRFTYDDVMAHDWFVLG